MDLIARREMFDLGEAGIFEAAGQDDVADQSIAAEHYSGETHAHLKSDAGFFGNHADGAASFYQFCEAAEERDGERGFAGEMFSQRDARAEMGLVAIGKGPGAFWAFPEWRWRHRVSRILPQIRQAPLGVRRLDAAFPASTRTGQWLHWAHSLERSPLRLSAQLILLGGLGPLPGRHAR